MFSWNYVIIRIGDGMENIRKLVERYEKLSSVYLIESNVDKKEQIKAEMDDLSVIIKKSIELGQKTGNDSELLVEATAKFEALTNIILDKKTGIEVEPVDEDYNLSSSYIISKLTGGKISLAGMSPIEKIRAVYSHTDQVIDSSDDFLVSSCEEGLRRHLASYPNKSREWLLTQAEIYRKVYKETIDKCVGLEVEKINADRRELYAKKQEELTEIKEAIKKVDEELENINKLNELIGVSIGLPNIDNIPKAGKIEEEAKEEIVETPKLTVSLFERLPKLSRESECVPDISLDKTASIEDLFDKFKEAGNDKAVDINFRGVKFMNRDWSMPSLMSAYAAYRSSVIVKGAIMVGELEAGDTHIRSTQNEVYDFIWRDIIASKPKHLDDISYCEDEILNPEIRVSEDGKNIITVKPTDSLYVTYLKLKTCKEKNIEAYASYGGIVLSNNIENFNSTEIAECYAKGVVKRSIDKYYRMQEEFAKPSYQEFPSENISVSPNKK